MIIIFEVAKDNLKRDFKGESCEVKCKFLVKVEELGKKIPNWKVVVIANNNGMVKDK
ncbi:hypothetical protein [uncultured Alteromonas sp.]|uniref:hypothetical protein n=1 Tax=uncultured Alteromonas sp. TaxID=179113 RepID=UPI0030CD77FD|tara:strand:- start:4450 stop:4620 length:171 start_codon:yes stop_codon:yes gene_type:complete